MNKPPVPGQPGQPDPATETERALDEALAESFPASDPVAIDIEHPDKAREAP